MEGLSTKKTSKYELSQWFDQLLPQGTTLPQQQQQQQSSNILKSRWFRWVIAIYIGFSFLFATLHVSSWVFDRSNYKEVWKYERTYDAGKAYYIQKKKGSGETY